MRRRTSPIWQPDAGSFRELIARSATLTEALTHFGLSMRGHNYRTLIRRCQEEGVSIEHFQARKGGQRRPPRPLAELLRVGSQTRSDILKRRLLAARLLPEACSACGLGPLWNGKPLTLQLEHRNGDPQDNRLENLTLLCPNCHSQTDTFSGRKAQQGRAMRRTIPCPVCGKPKPWTSQDRMCLRCLALSQRKVERPSAAILRQQVAELGYTGTGRLYGVSDNSIRKWIRQAEDSL